MTEPGLHLDMQLTGNLDGAAVKFEVSFNAPVGVDWTKGGRHAEPSFDSTSFGPEFRVEILEFAGFGARATTPLSINQLLALGRGIAVNGPAFGALIALVGFGSIRRSVDTFSKAYLGCWPSAASFHEDLAALSCIFPAPMRHTRVPVDSRPAAPADDPLPFVLVGLPDGLIFAFERGLIEQLRGSVESGERGVEASVPLSPDASARMWPATDGSDLAR